MGGALLCHVAGIQAMAPQAAPKAAADTYIWNGELVAVDSASRTITLKALVTSAALEEFKQFKSEDHVLLAWSGLDRFANSINRVVRNDGKATLADRFEFPAVFVAVDEAHRTVTFKTPYPADAMAVLNSAKPGEWLTVTSPHGKSSEAQPIMAIRGYNG
jgi:hypothetical protein